jgi:hypothetical protein
MGTANFNMEDPAKQEQIRRGTHEYVPTAGKHGSYVPRVYKRAEHEYPKMMGKWPRPQLADFKGQPDAQTKLELALKAWDDAMTASIVNSKAEEQQWLKANA